MKNHAIITCQGSPELLTSFVRGGMAGGVGGAERGRREFSLSIHIYIYIPLSPPLSPSLSLSLFLSLSLSLSLCVFLSVCVRMRLSICQCRCQCVCESVHAYDPRKRNVLGHIRSCIWFEQFPSGTVIILRSERPADVCLDSADRISELLELAQPSRYNLVRSASSHIVKFSFYFTL